VGKREDDSAAPNRSRGEEARNSSSSTEKGERMRGLRVGGLGGQVQRALELLNKSDCNGHVEKGQSGEWRKPLMKKP